METIYFAHPFYTIGINDEKILLKYLSESFDVINPFDNEDKILEKYGRTNYYPDPPLSLAKDFYYKDLEAINKADQILVWLPDKTDSIGTSYELSYYVSTKMGNANYTKPIVICSRQSPFFNNCDLYLSIDDYINQNKYIWN